MKRKNIVLYIAIAICVLACIFVLLVKVFNLNLIRHNTVQVGEFSVKYYGDFDSVHKVKIYDGLVRRGTFELIADKETVVKSNENAPYLKDINADGHEDMIIPHSKDVNLDVRYAAFLWNNDTQMFEACDILSDIANISVDDGIISSSMTLYKVVWAGGANLPEEYEKSYVSANYKIVDGKVMPLREYTLIYYSENDIYCHVKKDYNPENGEMIEFEEDWMTPKQAEKIMPKK